MSTTIKSKSTNSNNEFHLVEQEHIQYNTQYTLNPIQNQNIDTKHVRKTSKNQSLINRILAPKPRRKNKSSTVPFLKKPIKKSFYIYLLLGVVFTSVYYGIISSIRKDVVSEKVYHSLSLGILVLFQIILPHKQKTDSNKQALTEYLLETEEAGNYDIDNNEYIFYIIIVGILKFMTELNTFFLLEMTAEVGKNVALGFALTALEFTMVRFHYSMLKIKIEFSNFLGFLITFLDVILLVVMFLSISIAGLGLAVSALRFISYYIINQINRQFSRKRVFIGYNLIDFTIGLLLFILYFFTKREMILFDLVSIFLIFLATVFYYLSLRFFSQLDKYGYTIFSLTYLGLGLTDYLISGRSLSYVDLFLLTVIVLSIVLTFLGNKIFNCSKSDIKETCCHDKECVTSIKKFSENDCQELYIGNKGVLGILKAEEPLCVKCDTCVKENAENPENKDNK